MTWDIVLFWLCAVVTVGIAGPVLVLALVRWCFRLLRRPDGSDGHGIRVSVSRNGTIPLRFDHRTWQKRLDDGMVRGRFNGDYASEREEDWRQRIRSIRPVLKPGSKPPVLVSTPTERTELFELMSQPSQCIIVDDDEPFYPRKPPADDLKPLPYRLPYDGGMFRDEDEIDRIRRRNRRGK